MKLGTIILSVFVLFGCAAYTVTNHKAEQEAFKQEHEKLEKARIEFEVLQRKREEDFKVVMQSRPPMPTAAPAPSRVPSPEPVGSGSKVIVKPEKPTIIEKEKTDIVGRQLFSTQLAFALKESANVDETLKAQLLMSIKEEVNTLANQLTVTGPKTTATINVSKVVRANLVAPDFKVTNVTPEEQVIAENNNTEWEWLLKPTSPGKHEVTLTVTAIITVDGKEKPHHLKKFEKVLTIEVTKQQVLEDWWSENWKWVISTLIIPFLGFLFKEKIKKLLEKSKV